MSADRVEAEDLRRFSYLDELERIWGRRWGAQSEIGLLSYAMLSIPSDNEASPEAARDPVYYDLTTGVPDLPLMRRQHRELARVLEAEGVELSYLEPPPVMMGPYARNRMLWAPASAFVINGGAIIPRYGLAPWRRGFEVLLARRIMELGCPILYTVHGSGIFELGGNCQWLDPETLVIGLGPSANMEGVRQVWDVFKVAGVREIHLTAFKGTIHLDMALGLAGAWVAVVDPRCLDDQLLHYLKAKRIELIEVPPEEADNSACNTLPIDPERVIMPAGNPVTARRIRAHGVKVIEVEMSEFVKAGGGPHCATSCLVRDPGPKLPG